MLRFCIRYSILANKSERFAHENQAKTDYYLRECACVCVCKENDNNKGGYTKISKFNLKLVFNFATRIDILYINRRNSSDSSNNNSKKRFLSVSSNRQKLKTDIAHTHTEPPHKAQANKTACCRTYLILLHFCCQYSSPD